MIFPPSLSLNPAGPRRRWERIRSRQEQQRVIEKPAAKTARLARRCEQRKYEERVRTRREASKGYKEAIRFAVAAQRLAQVPAARSIAAGEFVEAEEEGDDIVSCGKRKRSRDSIAEGSLEAPSPMKRCLATFLAIGIDPRLVEVDNVEVFAAVSRYPFEK